MGSSQGLSSKNNLNPNVNKSPQENQQPSQVHQQSPSNGQQIQNNPHGPHHINPPHPRPLNMPPHMIYPPRMPIGFRANIRINGGPPQVIYSNMLFRPRIIQQRNGIVILNQPQNIIGGGNWYGNSPNQVLYFIRFNNFNNGIRRGANMLQVNSPAYAQFSRMYNQHRQNQPQQKKKEKPLREIKGVKIKKVKEKMEENCAVCCEEFLKDDEICYLPCEHCFHPGCIEEWFKSKQECPLCRKTFE